MRRKSKADPLTPPSTGKGLSVAPTAIADDPRDHTVLESIYLALHESRMINLEPLNIIPSYLTLYFGQIKTYPTLLFLAPDRKIDGAGVMGGRVEDGKGTPMADDGVVDIQTMRRFLTKAMNWDSPATPLVKAASEPAAQVGPLASSSPTRAVTHNADRDRNDQNARSRSSSTRDTRPILSRLRSPSQPHVISRSSSSPPPGNQTQDTGHDPTSRHLFVDDYIACDTTRPVQGIVPLLKAPAGDVSSKFFQNRASEFAYDVGHAGLLLSIAVASVLSCVEEMWEYAKELDPEAERLVFEEKVAQFVV